MGMIKDHHNGCNQHHHCDAQKRSWDKSSSNAMRRAVVIILGATRRPCQQTQQRCHEDVVSITTMLIMWQQPPSKEHQSPWRKHDERNQEPGGPLNRKPLVDWAYSCLRSPTTKTSRKTTTKQAKMNSQKTIKNTATWHLRHASRAQHSLDKQCRQSTDTVPSNNKTSASCNDNNEDKNCHLHFYKKIEGRLCCCVVPCKSDHQLPSWVKRAKRKRGFLHSWTTISIL